MNDELMVPLNRRNRHRCRRHRRRHSKILHRNTGSVSK